MKNIRVFIGKNQFLVVKISIYLNRRVFVMEYSHQPAHSQKLIRIITGHILDSQGCKVSSCRQRRLIRLCGCAGTLESWLAAHVKR